MAPEDITIFVGDDYNSQELFTDDTFSKHASGISPKTFSSIGFTQSPHGLINIRNNHILTNVNFSDKVVHIWDKNRDPEDDEVVPLDRAYTYDRMIISPTCLTDKNSFNRIRGYSRYLRTFKNKKRVVNTMVYPTTSYEMVTHDLINEKGDKKVLFVIEDMF